MASSGSSSTSSGPVATGSRRRRLVLRLSQKDALQALFQQNPYPGIATRERLARELGIAESRVQVWFQNQRRRRFKQSRSPPEHVHQEGEAGPTSTPAPPSRPPRPQSSSPGNLASALPIASPQEGPEPSSCQRVPSAGMVSKPKSSAPPAEPERARRRSSHDSSCSRGPKDPTRGPEHLSSPPPLPATGEHATLGGPSCSVWGPRLLGARDCPWGSPSVQVALLAAPGIPGSPGPFRGPLLSSQGPTQPSRVTQPPRGNPGCHGHPGHALVSPGPLRGTRG
nr:double homeobox protein 4C-like [Ovis aries]